MIIKFGTAKALNSFLKAENLPHSTQMFNPEWMNQFQQSKIEYRIYIFE